MLGVITTVTYAPVADPQLITVNTTNAIPLVLTGYDANEYPLSFAIVDPPSRGVLGSLNAPTGNVTYTPPAELSGSDSFTFSVTSGAVTSPPATVTIILAPPAALISPLSGSTFTSSSVAFMWNAGTGVSHYWLTVGTGASGANAKNLYAGEPTTALAATVTGLPTYGQPIYVTLSSEIGGVWQSIVYNYTEAGAPVAATLTTPTPSAKLTSSSVTFTWSAGEGVTYYWFNLGTASSPANAKNIYSGSSTTATSVTVTGLPTNGETIYATLYSYIGGVWQPTVYTYTASGTPTPATLTTPAPSSKLTSSTVTFTWSPGSGVPYFWFNMGTGTSATGAKNLYTGASTTATSVTVTGLPTNGETIYATLYSYIGGVWQPTVYTYTASGSPTPAVLTTPAPSTTLTGSTVTFTWSAGSGVPYFWFNLGSGTSATAAKNIYSGSSTTATSVTVTGLPTNGETIYATLYSYIGGAWQPTVYTYTAQ